MNNVDGDDCGKNKGEDSKENTNVKEMMNLLSEANPNLGAFGNMTMDKEQLLESFLLFQKIMSLNMAVGKNKQSVNIAEGGKIMKENKEDCNVIDNKAKENNEDKEKNKERIEEDKGIIKKEQVDNEENENINQEHIMYDADNGHNEMMDNCNSETKEINENDDYIVNDNKPKVDKRKDIQPEEVKNNDYHENKEDDNEPTPSLSNFLSEPRKPQIPIATSIQNTFDEMPIRPSSNNFIELLERNLQNNDNFQPPTEPKKKIIRQPPAPKRQIAISKPSKEEIKKYTYYSDNFEDNDQEAEEKEKKKKIKEQQQQLQQQIQQKKAHAVPNKEKQHPIVSKQQPQQESKVNKPRVPSAIGKNTPSAMPAPSSLAKGENALNKFKRQSKTSLNSNINNSSINQTAVASKKNWEDSNFDQLDNTNDKEPLRNDKKYQGANTPTNPLQALSFGGPKANFMVGFSCQNNDSNKNIPLVNNDQRPKSGGPYQKRTIQKQAANLSLDTPTESNQRQSNNKNIQNDYSNIPINNADDDAPDNNTNLQYDYSQHLNPSNEQFENLSNLIIEPRQNNDSINDKEMKLNQQIEKMKNDNLCVTKLREEYEKLNQKLQRDMKEFNSKKEQDYEVFEAFKEEETKKIALERKKLVQDQKIYNENKLKAQTSIGSVSKKDKDTIEQLKAQLLKSQEDNKLKENTNKLLIDRLKKQLEEANNTILELNQQLIKSKQSRQSLINNNNNNNYSSNPSTFTSVQNTSADPPSAKSRVTKAKSKDVFTTNQINHIDQYQYQTQNIIKGNSNNINNNNTQQQSNKKTSNTLKKASNNNNDNNDDNNEEEDTFDMIFPDKYHKTEYTFIKQETSDDGKIVRFYDQDKKEILFSSGVRKEIFSDGYQIVYFNNGDLKQIFPSGKSVYYFSDAKTIQTTLHDKQVFKFENGQIEKHHKDGTKQIAFPDGSLRYILPDGSEETYYLDGKIQRSDVNGVITLEYPDGAKEIKYPDGREVIEYNEKK